MNLEKELAQLKQDIEDLKVCQAVAGSLIDMHVYTARSQIEKLQNRYFKYNIKFTPKNMDNPNNFAVVFYRLCRRDNYYGYTGVFIVTQVTTDNQVKILDGSGYIEIDETASVGKDYVTDYYLFVTVYSNCEGNLTVNSSIGDQVWYN